MTSYSSKALKGTLCFKFYIKFLKKILFLVSICVGGCGSTYTSEHSTCGSQRPRVSLDAAVSPTMWALVPKTRPLKEHILTAKANLQPSGILASGDIEIIMQKKMKYRITQ